MERGERMDREDHVDLAVSEKTAEVNGGGKERAKRSRMERSEVTRPTRTCSAQLASAKIKNGEQ